MTCMSNEILKLVYGFDTFREAWLKLENSFSFRFKEKMIQLKGEIAKFKERKSWS